MNPIVIDIVIVAALVSGNDAVDLIDTVLDQGSMRLVSIATIRSTALVVVGVDQHHSR